MGSRSVSRNDWIREQAAAFANEILPACPRIFRDTSRYMYIDRGDVVELEDRFFLVRGNEREGRFSIDEQPKFWVKRAIELETGRSFVLKLGIEETFRISVGGREIRCFRSPAKEAQVLAAMRGDASFMQGETVRDAAGNIVRILDFISGTDLLSYLHSIPRPHEEYFHEVFPSVLANIIGSLRAIARLHEAGLCHGDIRNDHVLIEKAGGQYKWIDFDLDEDFPEFDAWSLGNVLHCVVAKGFLTFRDAFEKQPQLREVLSSDDASAFFTHRVMNLRAVYPYVPEALNRVLMRFAVGARTPYERVSQIAEELSAISG